MGDFVDDEFSSISWDLELNNPEQPVQQQQVIEGLPAPSPSFYRDLLKDSDEDSSPSKGPSRVIFGTPLNATPMFRSSKEDSQDFDFLPVRPPNFNLASSPKTDVKTSTTLEISDMEVLNSSNAVNSLSNIESMETSEKSGSSVETVDIQPVSIESNPNAMIATAEVILDPETTAVTKLDPMARIENLDPVTTTETSLDPTTTTETTLDPMTTTETHLDPVTTMETHLDPATSNPPSSLEASTEDAVKSDTVVSSCSAQENLPQSSESSKIGVCEQEKTSDDSIPHAEATTVLATESPVNHRTPPSHSQELSRNPAGRPPRKNPTKSTRITTTPPSRKRDTVFFTTNEYDSHLYNYCWPVLKKLGWSYKPGGDGLNSYWTYLAPQVKRCSDGIDKVNMFKSEQMLMQYIEEKEVDLFLEAKRELRQQYKQEVAVSPPVVKKMKKSPTAAEDELPRWSEVWNELVELGWSVQPGVGLESWRYVLPGRVGRKLVKNEDYLVSQEEVMEYYLAGGNSKKSKKKSIQDTSSKQVPTKPFSFEADLWPELKSKGWTYALGTGTVDYIFYPTKTPNKQGKRGTDFFLSREEVMEFVQHNA